MVNEKEIIVSLDVGTTKVCTIVAQRSHDSEVEIIGVGNHPSNGLKKGSVVNIDKTIKSIQSSVEEARLMSGVDIEKSFNWDCRKSYILLQLERVLLR